jgi:prophage regulatory protein
MTAATRIHRVPSTCERTGKPRSALYADIKAGTWPPGVSLGGRAVGWPEYEIDAINRARIAGQTDDEIRELVRALLRQRKALVQHTEFAS